MLKKPLKSKFAKFSQTFFYRTPEGGCFYLCATVSCIQLRNRSNIINLAMSKPKNFGHFSTFMKRVKWKQMERKSSFLDYFRYNIQRCV